MKFGDKNFNFLLGLTVCLIAFLSVFGSQLKNLKIDKAAQQSMQESNNITVVKDTATVPETNTTKTNTSSSTSTTSKPTTSTTSTSSTTTTTSTPGGYTMTQISSHNSATTCWSAINGNVYDLTDWVDGHPGGRAAILMICGKDGSGLFNMQHGRSSSVASILADFKIGNLNA